MHNEVIMYIEGLCTKSTTEIHEVLGVNEDNYAEYVKMFVKDLGFLPWNIVTREQSLMLLEKISEQEEITKEAFVYNLNEDVELINIQREVIGLKLLKLKDFNFTEQLNILEEYFKLTEEEVSK